MTDLSPAEYTTFLREKLSQELKGTIILLGTPDDNTSVSIGSVAFNDLSCGLVIRPDSGKTVAATQGMDAQQCTQYLLENQPDNQVVLVFVDVLDAGNFLSEKCMWAVNALAQRNGIANQYAADDFVAALGAKAHSDLIKLRRASRALVAALKAQDTEAIAQAQARIEALTGKVG